MIHIVFNEKGDCIAQCAAPVIPRVGEIVRLPMGSYKVNQVEYIIESQSTRVLIECTALRNMSKGERIRQGHVRPDNFGNR